MSTKRHLFSCFYFSLFGVATSYAQTSVLHVGTEEQLYIPAQSIVSMKGLVYEPSQDLTLTNNTLIKAQEVLHPLENAQPISYQWKNLINEYSGSISMSIEELDLGDEEKENLVMYHYNNKWIFNTQNQISDDRLSIQGTFVNNSFLEHSLSISEDSDFDGVLNDNDECPDSEFGATVDAKGCEIFSLPSNTFTVSATSAACKDASNGSITISSLNTDYNYRFSIDGQNPIALNNTTQTIPNLAAGVYSVCVTVSGVTNYERCYTIEINEPAPLVVNSKVDNRNRSLDLNLSGSKTYQITLNRQTFSTTEKSLSLTLQPGMNRIEVATDLNCQEVYIEEIFVSEEVKVYPNPTNGPLQFFIPGSDTEVKMRITTLSGNVIREATLKVTQTRAMETSLSGLPRGLYLITLEGETVKTTHKVIKE